MVKICIFVLKILSRHKIPALIKDHNSGIDERRMMCDNLSLDLVNINAYTKLGDKSVNLFSRYLAQKKLVKFKGHNSGTNVRKNM